MERNAEIVRQWKVLRRIANSADCTVASLVAEHGVCRRTIYRDLEALQSAGFPLYDVRLDRQVFWRMDGSPFRGLSDTAFTFSELCAFYVNRSRLASSGAAPVQDDVQTAMEKLTGALSPKMREYLDRLTTIVTWKPEPGERPKAGPQAQLQEEILRAVLEHRALKMTYHSFSSRKVKEYTVEPYRLTFGNGGLYLYAFVRAYGEMRSFALQRIRGLKVLEQHFSPVQELNEEPFEHSLGVFTGDPQSVTIRFSPAVAPYVEEGQWHPSQSIERQSDGSVVFTLSVCIDLPLRTWILSFGRQAQVLEPESLARSIVEELEAARELYPRA